MIPRFDPYDSCRSHELESFGYARTFATLVRMRRLRRAWNRIINPEEWPTRSTNDPGLD